MSIRTQRVEYTHDGTLFEGYAAFPDTPDKKPLVLIAHAWGGRDAFVCEKADAIATLGAVGFAWDLYGKGVLGTSPESNMALMQPLIDDRAHLVERLKAAMTAATVLEGVDNEKIGAIGYCFGGLCVLDFVRAGAKLKGAVSFHGKLTPPNTPTKPHPDTKLLVLHGYDDPMVPPTEVMSFADEMTNVKLDWQIHMYGNTQHAFTNPAAKHPTLGLVYNADAATRAWQAMQHFFQALDLLP
jgi:dienelactone hydrolase